MVSAAPRRALLVRQDGRTWSEPAHVAMGRRLTVGRTAASDVPVDHPLVSRDHVVLELTDEATTPGEWWLALGMTAVVAAAALVAAPLLLLRRAEPSRPR